MPKRDLLFRLPAEDYDIVEILPVLFNLFLGWLRRFAEYAAGGEDLSDSLHHSAERRQQEVTGIVLWDLLETFGR